MKNLSNVSVRPRAIALGYKRFTIPTIIRPLLHHARVYWITLMSQYSIRIWIGVTKGRIRVRTFKNSISCQV